MKKIPLSLFLISISFYPLCAQFNLTGQIFNEKNQPLIYATIAVYPLTDSNSIRGSVSDDFGLFSIKNLPATNYKIVIQMLGYQD